MGTAATTLPTYCTVADLLEHLGPIPPRRIRLHPTPGTATEQDVIDIEAREDRLCELTDGVLVEKATGYDESRLALVLGYFMEDFLQRHNLGTLAGEAGMLRFAPGMVRIPDLSFVSWERFRKRKNRGRAIARVVPDLVVEVLNPSNTKKEMDRKLGEYFKAGVRLVWYIDPRGRTVDVYTAPDPCTRLHQGQTLGGGDVLPGFSLPLRKLFGRANQQRGNVKR